MFFEFMRGVDIKNNNKKDGGDKKSKMKKILKVLLVVLFSLSSALYDLGICGLIVIGFIFAVALLRWWILFVLAFCVLLNIPHVVKKIKHI